MSDLLYQKIACWCIHVCVYVHTMVAVYIYWYMVCDYTMVLSAEGLMCAFSPRWGPERPLLWVFCSLGLLRGGGDQKATWTQLPFSENLLWTRNSLPKWPEPTYTGPAGSSPCCSAPLDWGLGRWLSVNTGCPHSRGRKEPRGEKAGEESQGGKNPQWVLGLQVPVKTFVIKSLTLIVASTYFGVSGHFGCWGFSP